MPGQPRPAGLPHDRLRNSSSITVPDPPLVAVCQEPGLVLKSGELIPKAGAPILSLGARSLQ